MDDSRIVDLFLARDEAAIKESAMKYGQALRKIANNILSDQETVRAFWLSEYRFLFLGGGSSLAGKEIRLESRSELV